MSKREIGRDAAARVLREAGWKPRTNESASGRAYFIFSKNPGFSEAPSSGNVLYDATTSPEKRMDPLEDLVAYDQDLYDIQPLEIKSSEA